MSKRLDWVDQTKGIGIFLMIYAHNFPIIETYIYTFHMPLFFFIAGMFHPKTTSLQSIIYRAKSILIPYFVWSFLLFLFWFFIGRHYGNSIALNPDPLNNFIGIFYAQGGSDFMNWGIPMWFLPCIFLTFLFYSFLQKISNKWIFYFGVLILVLFGFIYPKFSKFNLPWSVDVACVSLVFYSIGNLLKTKLIELNSKLVLRFLILMLVIHFSLAFLNSKVDMYRSIYGNELLFIINGLSGTLALLLLFKIIKVPKFLSYLGKNTIPLLALQGRAMTIIKFVLLAFGVTVFNFNEPTKFALTFVQILLILPILILVNRYAPILNGRVKK